MYYLFPKLY